MARTQYPSISKVIVSHSKIVTLSEQQKEDEMWESLLRNHHTNCEKSKCNDKRINGLYACQFSSINGRMYNAYLRYKRRREAYKSKLCRNFHGTGFCMTGKECPFVHNIWEPYDSEHGNNFLFQSEMSAAFKTSLNTSYMNKCAFYSDSSSFGSSEICHSDVRGGKLSSLSSRFRPSDLSGCHKVNVHKFSDARSLSKLHSDLMQFSGSGGGVNCFSNGSVNGAYNACSPFNNGVAFPNGYGQRSQLQKRQQNWSSSVGKSCQPPAFFETSNVYSQVPDDWTNFRY